MQAEFIENDPHIQSNNGRILAGIIRRHEIVVANGLKGKCSGVITRKRVTIDNTEESAIDFVILSNDMVESLESLYIDEERKHVLTKYTKSKSGTKIVESDHNVLYSKFKLNWSKTTKKNKIETFNLKNKECQSKFKAPEILTPVPRSSSRDSMAAFINALKKLSSWKSLIKSWKSSSTKGTC